MTIKKIKDGNNNDVYPITTYDAVITNSGHGLAELLDISNNTAMVDNFQDKEDGIKRGIKNILHSKGVSYNSSASLKELVDLLVGSSSGGTSVSTEYILTRSNIELGTYFSFVLGCSISGTGTALGTGANGNGQLGLGNYTDCSGFNSISISNIKKISCGFNNTYLLLNNGELWGTGYRTYGQLGDGTGTSRNSFAKIFNSGVVKDVIAGGFHVIVIKSDDSIVACGHNGYRQTGTASSSDSVTTFSSVNITNVKKIVCGYSHTLFLKKDNTLWGCGSNASGQLGLGTSTSSETLTHIADNIADVFCHLGDHTIAKKIDGTFIGCGYNNYGQVGINGTVSSITGWTNLSGIDHSKVKTIACGRYSTFALYNDGSLWAAGYDQYGGLGLSSNPDGSTSSYLYRQFKKVTANINNDVAQIAAGQYHAMIVKKNGSVWATGQNSDGQLGLSDTAVRRVFTNTGLTVVLIDNGSTDNSGGSSSTDSNRLIFYNNGLTNNSSIKKTGFGFVDKSTYLYASRGSGSGSYYHSLSSSAMNFSSYSKIRILACKVTASSNVSSFDCIFSTASLCENTTTAPSSITKSYAVNLNTNGSSTVVEIDISGKLANSNLWFGLRIGSGGDFRIYEIIFEK